MTASGSEMTLPSATSDLDRPKVGCVSSWGRTVPPWAGGAAGTALRWPGYGSARAARSPRPPSTAPLPPPQPGSKFALELQSTVDGATGGGREQDWSQASRALARDRGCGFTLQLDSRPGLSNIPAPPVSTPQWRDLAVRPASPLCPPPGRRCWRDGGGAGSIYPPTPRQAARTTSELFGQFGQAAVGV